MVLSLGDENWSIARGHSQIRLISQGVPESAPSENMLELPAPVVWLAGSRGETLLAGSPALETRRTGLWQWWRAGDCQLATASVSFGAGPVREDLVREVYAGLLAQLTDWKLLRVWNFVPRINAWQAGQENYRRFNQGRAQAFGSAPLPAASAVGAAGDEMVILALSGSTPPAYHENPEQVPAYRYPEQYGPMPPSFARGSVTRLGGRQVGFISGTAAIKGHESQAGGDLAGQIAVTLDNLRLMAERLGFPGALESSSPMERFFRVYLRNAADAEKALVLLAKQGLGLAPHEFTMVRAEICRAELDIEIEARLAQ